MLTSGLVFGSRRFLKKVASRDSEKSLGDLETPQSPGEAQAEENKVTFNYFPPTFRIIRFRMINERRKVRFGCDK